MFLVILRLQRSVEKSFKRFKNYLNHLKLFQVYLKTITSLENLVLKIENMNVFKYMKKFEVKLRNPCNYFNTCRISLKVK